MALTEADGVAAVMGLIALGALMWAVMKPDTVSRELKGRWPLAKKRLYGDRQREAMDELQQALQGFRVMSGVSLSRMLYVEPRGTASEMRERSSYWAERRNRASVDFVVCDEVGEILAAVDMLGSKELRGAGARAQAEKERMLEAAGICVFNLASMSAAAVGRAIWEYSSADERDGGRGDCRGSGGPGVVPDEVAQGEGGRGGGLAV